MAVPDAGVVRDHDVQRLRRAADSLRLCLDRAVGGGPGGEHHTGEALVLRHASGNRQSTLLELVLKVMAKHEGGDGQTDQQHDRQERDLEEHCLRPKSQATAWPGG